MMRTKLLFFLAASSCFTGLAQSDEEAIKKVLTDQVQAWNKGEIETYMQGYWNSEQTEFLSGGNIARGYKEVLSRYEKAYGSREKMGTLEFDELQIRKLGPDAAMVSGIWKLTRKTDKPWGRFTLIVERKTEGWKITHDHTSQHTP